MRTSSSAVVTTEIIEAFDYLEYSPSYKDRRADIIVSTLAVNYNLKTTLVNWLSQRNLAYRSVRQCQINDALDTEVSKLYCNKLNLFWKLSDDKTSCGGNNVLCLRNAEDEVLHVDTVVSGYSSSSYKCPCTIEVDDMVLLSMPEVEGDTPASPDDDTETHASSSSSGARVCDDLTNWWQVVGILVDPVPPGEKDAPLTQTLVVLDCLRTGARRSLHPNCLLGAVIKRTVPLSPAHRSTISGREDVARAINSYGDLNDSLLSRASGRYKDADSDCESTNGDVGGGTGGSGRPSYYTSAAFRLPAPDVKGALAVFRANMKACVAISNRLAPRTSSFVLQQCKAWLTGKQLGNYIKRLFQQHYRDYQYCVGARQQRAVGRFAQHHATARLQTALGAYYTVTRWSRVGLLLKYLSVICDQAGTTHQDVDVFYALWCQWSGFFDGVVHQFLAGDCERWWHTRLRCTRTTADHSLLVRARAFTSAHTAALTNEIATGTPETDSEGGRQGSHQEVPAALRTHPHGQAGPGALTQMVREVQQAAARSVLNGARLGVTGFACDCPSDICGIDAADGLESEAICDNQGVVLVQGLEKAYRLDSQIAKCSNNTLRTVRLPATIVVGDILALPLSAAYLWKHYIHASHKSAVAPSDGGGHKHSGRQSYNVSGVAPGSHSGSGTATLAHGLHYYEVVGVDMLGACLKLTPLTLGPDSATTLHDVLTHRIRADPDGNRNADPDPGRGALRVTLHCLWKVLVYRICPQVSLIGRCVADGTAADGYCEEGSAVQRNSINYTLFQLPLPNAQAILADLVSELELITTVLS